MRRWLYGTRTLALALTFFVLHTLPAGCASRTLPTRFPSSSAASSAAREGRPAAVTGALTEEPPLPGQPTTRWPGLHVGDAEQPAHGGHHGR